MDFTLRKYAELLAALKKVGYTFASCASDTALLTGNGVGDESFCLLRHDVDLNPQRSLATARLEAGLGVRAIYYFRAVPESWDEEIIRAISALGHEVGYHYESLTTCRGDVDAAWKDFCHHLERLRALVPVTSVCMHGSPRSPYDSKEIWKSYDYRTLGVTFEPYLDTDFSRMFYLTDTGRRWDGYTVSVRDRIPHYQEEWTKRGLVYHATDDVIRAAKEGTLPHCIMMTTHPQRWTDSLPAWMSELLRQHLKNAVKWAIVRLK